MPARDNALAAPHHRRHPPRPANCQSCDGNGQVLAAGRDPEPCTECNGTGRAP